MAVAAIAALSPCWALADDQQIAQQIVQRLRQEKAEGRLTGFGIDLEVESGIVWLKGHVTTPEQQQLVLDIARRVDGVTNVVNDLSIKEAVAQAPPKVRPALLQSEGSSPVLEKPAQLLGNLKGTVQRALRQETRPESAEPAPRPHTAARQPAPRKPAEPTPAQAPEVVAARTTPVAQTRPTAPNDEELAEEIISRLRTQKDRGTLQHFDVDVRVNERVVWVSGRVASESQRALVLDVARRVRGVKQVVNDLAVQDPDAVQVVSAPIVDAAPAAPSASPLAMPVGTVMAPMQAPAPLPYAAMPQQYAPAARPVPLAFAPAQSVGYTQPVAGQPMPEMPAAAGIARARFDNPAMPGYAWPSYAAYPNYAAVTYPKQYSPTAWPYIGPFYPYPQVPLGWRKVTLQWDDGWWFLDFKSK
jgi:osmotically-inducible protein OsmY